MAMTPALEESVASHGSGCNHCSAVSWRDPRNDTGDAPRCGRQQAR